MLGQVQKVCDGSFILAWGTEPIKQWVKDFISPLRSDGWRERTERWGRWERSASGVETVDGQG